jgi:hypothetical protein
MAAVLETLITGEFAGRRPSQTDFIPMRPVCKPSDCATLRAAAHDTAAFDAFYKRCNLIESTIDETQVHSIAHLPPGYCDTLKTAFEDALAKEVYGPPRAGDWVEIEYKGSRYRGTRRALARGAHLQAACLADGFLRISAPRNRR